jgi:hypothetical protein
MSNKSPKIKTINDQVLEDTAATLNLPLKLVKDVVINGQSKFTAHTIASNTFDGIRWPYFGVFKAKHKIVQVLSYMKGLDPVQKTFFRNMLKLQRQKNKAAKIAEKQALTT